MKICLETFDNVMVCTVPFEVQGSLSHQSYNLFK